MADLQKVKRNVKRMVEMDAPEEDIDAYIAGEGVTLDQLKGVSSQPSAAPAQGNPDYWSMGKQATDTVTFGGSTKLAAAGVGALDSAIDWMRGEGFNYSDNYNRLLEQERANQQAYAAQNPIRSGVGTAAGIALGVTSLPTVGTGLVGAAGTGATYGGIAGALRDAESFGERVENTFSGGRAGLGIGLLGYGAGKAIGWGANKLSDAYRKAGASPQLLGEQKVYDITEKVGRGKVQQRLDELGPDAVAADALGKRGTAMARRAANLDPDAREVIDDTLLGRKAGQNARIVTDMEKIAGIKPGNEKSVEQLVKAVDDQFGPEINRLYTQARQAGKDMPLQFFDDVLGTEQGKAVYNEAAKAVTARARLSGAPDDVSNLAIIDEMKKIFDSKSRSAFQSGDKAASDLWSDFARNLRMRADTIMDQADDPIYSQARALAQQAYRAKEAITMGESLGAGRVPLDLPAKSQSVDLGNRQRMAQGYVSKKTDTLLNRGSTDGALNELSTPMGKRAADTALGPDNLAPSVNRERTFNATTRQLLGNSTTAQQLMDDGGMGVVQGLLGSPLTTARDLVGKMVASLATDKQRAMAPVVARVLMSRNLPTQSPIPPTLVQRMLNAGDEKAAKALLLAWERQAPQPAR